MFLFNFDNRNMTYKATEELLRVSEWVSEWIRALNESN